MNAFEEALVVYMNNAWPKEAIAAEGPRKGRSHDQKTHKAPESGSKTPEARPVEDQDF